jgi:D-serine dehydratase
MARFLEASGALLAPHGKTYMSPELFAMQLGAGAWGITVSTAQQARVCREFGVSRILMANQLVDPVGIRYILDELQGDDAFEFLCLVDSVQGVAILERAVAAHPTSRPLDVLLEVGFPGGRTGCRDLEGALAVARAVRAAQPHLRLRGVEGFEGLLMLEGSGDRTERVDAFLGTLTAVARECEAARLFAPGGVILSAGGSAFYYRVVEELGRVGLRQDTLILSRSGCYLTSDSGFFRSAHERLRERSSVARGLGDGLRPALEIWTYVQSRPEPGLAILTMGKREAGYDLGWPVALAGFRPGHDPAPRPLAEGHSLRGMNDQHAYLDVPPESPLEVGDLVMCGISHPCLTFDRWQWIPIVDDDYNVVSAVRTFF